MSRIVKLTLIVAILLFGLVFHLRNSDEISLYYYVGTVDMPLSLVIVLALILGALLGMLASLPAILTLMRQKRRLEKQAKEREQEINNLRVMPVKD